MSTIDVEPTIWLKKVEKVLSLTNLDIDLFTIYKAVVYLSLVC